MNINGVTIDCSLQQHEMAKRIMLINKRLFLFSKNPSIKAQRDSKEKKVNRTTFEADIQTTDSTFKG
jgi:hypothetical protein